MAIGPAYCDNDLVFASGVGTPTDPSALLRAWRRIAESAGGAGLRFHDLRHAHATLMLAQGTHAKVVSERLGHASTSTTMDTYSHVLPTLQIEAAARLDDLIFAEQ